MLPDSILLISLASLFILAGISYLHKSRQPASPVASLRSARFLGIPPQVWLWLITALLIAFLAIYTSPDGGSLLFFDMLFPILLVTLFILFLSLFFKPIRPFLKLVLSLGTAISFWFLICTVLTWVLGFGRSFPLVALLLPIGYTLLYVAYRFFQPKAAAAMPLQRPE